MITLGHPRPARATNSRTSKVPPPYIGSQSKINQANRIGVLKPSSAMIGAARNSSSAARRLR
ncbi:MAG TPA: hypothetical protein VIP98_06195 [Microlunatus sp.]